MPTTYDLIVLGAGSGGLAAAKRATSHGKKVLIIEQDRVGGTCVIRGCVPKKIMSYAANYADHLQDMQGYGFAVPDTPIDFSTFVTKRNAEVARLEKIHTDNLAKAEVEIAYGQAVFKDVHTVQVGTQTYQADHFIIATGGRPFMPSIEGKEHAIVSDGVFELTDLPKRLAIVGGGYIGVEFASIFNALGSKVELIIRRNTMLGGFDDDIRDALTEEMHKRGITCHPICNVEKLTKNSDGVCVALDTGKELCVDTILFATGRVPNTDGLGLEVAGIDLDKRGAIVVNDKLQTNQPHIYAIGDVTNRVNLTPVAVRDGRMVAENLFNEGTQTTDDANIATAVFTSPPLGVVGLTQTQAQEKLGDDISVHHTKFRPMINVLAERDEKMFMKIIAQKSTGKLLGMHIMGRDAPEMAQLCGVLVKMGATMADLHATMPIHPSSAEELVLLG